MARVSSRTTRIVVVATALVAVAASGSAASGATCPPGTGELSGVVTDADTGAPLDRVTSVGIEATDGSYSDGEGTDPTTSRLATCVPVGSYVVSYTADGYFPEWFDDAATAASATVVVVADGGAVDVSEDLHVFPTLVGRVVDQRGRPLFSGIGISFADGTPYDGEGTVGDGSGRFRLVFDPRSHPLGQDWVISFQADGHWWEWYDDQRRLSRATVFTFDRDTGVVDLGDVSLRPCGRPDLSCVPRTFFR